MDAWVSLATSVGPPPSLLPASWRASERSPGSALASEPWQLPGAFQLVSTRSRVCLSPLTCPRHPGRGRETQQGRGWGWGCREVGRAAWPLLSPRTSCPSWVQLPWEGIFWAGSAG